jgi:hypothetical protein
VNNRGINNSKSNIKKVLLLGGSHGRGLRECLISTLGDEHMLTNIYKPHAMLGNVVGELKALSKDFSKNDHVIVVAGPGAFIGTHTTKFKIM